MPNLLGITAYLCHILASMRSGAGTQPRLVMKKSVLLAAFAVIAILITTSRATAQSDVAFYAVFKTQVFEQGNPIAPALREQDSQNDRHPLSFGVFIATTASNSVSSATIQAPGGNPLVISPNDGGDSSFNFSAGFETKLELDSGYGDGDYTVVINAANDGQKTITLNLSGDTYPNAPRISNLLAGRAIDHTSDFTLTWDAFVGGGANDIIMVEVEQDSSTNSSTVFATPSPGAPGQLIGTATSVVIPANTLSPGSSYEITVRFIKGVTQTAVYASGLSGYMKETRAVLMTVGTGAADSQAPQLSNTKPRFGEHGVTDTSVVVFEFNEAMDTGVTVGSAITWAGLANPAGFAYSWSADARRLFCNYTNNLPLNTRVTWTLNPSGASEVLQDAAGNDLPSNFTGEFNTATNSSAGLPAVESLILLKGQALFQSNATPVNVSQYFVKVEGELRGLNTASALKVSGPNGGPLEAMDEHSGDSLELVGFYAEKSDLDTFIPNGSYTNDFTTFRDGDKSIVLTVSADNYPNDPTIQNIGNLASVDPNAALNLSWGAFAGGTVDDFIGIEIENDQGRTIYESPSPTEGGFLNGTATGTSIPAGTLAPGRTYEAQLTFGKVVDTETNAYPGVLAVAVFVKVTEFELTTTGSPIVPRLETVGLNNGQFQLRVRGEYRKIYTVQYSQSLTNNMWQDVFSSNTDSVSTNGTGAVEITDHGSNGSMLRFYRAYEGFNNQQNNQGGGAN